MKIEYLLFNIFCFISPIVTSTLLPVKKIRINIRAFALAILLPAVAFIVYDVLATNVFWSFNQKYILGLTLFSVPFEEILFFITVPSACLFLWIHIQYRMKKETISSLLPKSLAIILLVVGLFSLFNGLLYTGSVLIILAGVMILDSFMSAHIFRKKQWYMFLILVILLTLIFNYYLTARPIVLYSQDYRTGLMILTIPIEDFIFGLGLISMNAVLYKVLSERRIN